MMVAVVLLLTVVILGVVEIIRMTEATIDRNSDSLIGNPALAEFANAFNVMRIILR